jgi:hypothetical protein
MKPNRLDRVMRELEGLQNDADGIIDAYVNEVLAYHPQVASWGETKAKSGCYPGRIDDQRR